ncbi:MAG TPA: elongation factor EF-2 [Thermoplasmata archaeon]|nr:elongation factor EF-2 [Thermoplasmata archaeon]
MGRREEMIKKATEIMHDPTRIHNIGIAAHIDHGKTTLSDNLLAGAGMMSEELAGKQLVLDFDEQEQARGITINAASVSMVHELEGKEYLINLIDTPGHVDFGGDVTRAMRAVDGCVIVVCAVEGAMPQTETVVRQALKEKVKPVLFINKVDRLINELQVTPKQMQERFIKIIKNVNELIRKMAPKELKDEWQVKVEDGSVAFGSAYYNWAISIPFMKKSGITFNDIYNYCKNNDQKSLAKKAPLHRVLLNMVIRHLPNAVTAQNYRIPHIWHGDPESKIGKAMVSTDENGPLTLMITKITTDPHAGDIAAGRVFSGRIRKGDMVKVIGQPGLERVQQVGFFVGQERVPVDEVVAGNIAAVTGIKSAVAGSTVSSDENMEPFEKIVHYSDPVITKAIEAKHMKDLPKLVDVLRQIAKEDPSIEVTINQETGEHLISGMGELHLEVTEYKIEHYKGVEIKSSPPIVVYRESVSAQGGPFEGKSPNKHNKFYIEVEPLEPEVIDKIKSGEIDIGTRIKDKKGLAKILQDAGMNKEEAKGVYAIEGMNLLTNVSKGVQYLFETRELIIEAFREAMNRAPLTEEPVYGVKVKLVDAKLHEDSIHRGPAQVIPAVRSAIYGAMLEAKPIILEPKQKVFIDVPMDLMGAVNRELMQRRAEILDMEQTGDMTRIIGKAPVAEMFGFSSAIRSVTGGRVLWSTENAGFEPLPKELEAEVIEKVRTRKGLNPKPPTIDKYRS